jgi:hypothetical protein
MAALGIVWFIVIIALCAFMVWVYWKIFSKAGFNGAMSLLMLVPIANLVAILLLAFSRWPIEDELARLKGGGRPMPPPGSIGGPPATTTV